MQLYRLPARGNPGHQAGGVVGELVVPVRTDDQQRDRPHRLRDELQQLQRRLVGPLQVIEHEQYRTAAGEPLQKTGYGVEQAKPRCPGVPRTTGIDRGRRVDQLREQPSQLRGIGPDQLGDVIVIQGGQQRAQRYAPRPKRRCALGFSTWFPSRGPAHCARPRRRPAWSYPSPPRR